jgi:hypothetical protein
MHDTDIQINFLERIYKNPHQFFIGKFGVNLVEVQIILKSVRKYWN